MRSGGMIASVALAAGLLQAPPLPAEKAIANPASVYCVQQGGRVEIVTTDKGQIGICVLPDGRRIEEWEFFRGRAQE
jgi:putative hemolysin